MKRRARLLDTYEVRTAQEIHAAQAIMNAHIRKRLSAIGPEVAPLLAAEKNRALCAKIMEDAIYDALTELSETRLGVVDDDGRPVKTDDEAKL